MYTLQTDRFSFTQWGDNPLPPLLSTTTRGAYVCTLLEDADHS